MEYVLLVIPVSVNPGGFSGGVENGARFVGSKSKHDNGSQATAVHNRHIVAMERGVVHTRGCSSGLAGEPRMYTGVWGWFPRLPVFNLSINLAFDLTRTDEALCPRGFRGYLGGRVLALPLPLFEKIHRVGSVLELPVGYIIDVIPCDVEDIFGIRRKFVGLVLGAGRSHEDDTLLVDALCESYERNEVVPLKDLDVVALGGHLVVPSLRAGIPTEDGRRGRAVVSVVRRGRYLRLRRERVCAVGPFSRPEAKPGFPERSPGQLWADVDRLPRA